MVFSAHLATWVLSALTVLGVIFRPFRWPEWIFAVTGAALLVLIGLLPPAQALAGVLSGLDVYLFLAGMMLLAETARREGLFDTLAAHAARAARGSPQRLFALVYLMGTLVTVFLSNDATAVVLTPAVIAVTRAAKVASPIPYLLVCAFVANAASFVLPISNPANLVVFGEHLPALGPWLAGLRCLRSRQSLAPICCCAGRSGRISSGRPTVRFRFPHCRGAGGSPPLAWPPVQWFCSRPPFSGSSSACRRWPPGC